ncbi:hypothetical protein L0128_10055 [candidate division KSB1 bacterium]|nr:hypothetical protein [candidate division KSB1 bacterium]
MTTPTPTISKQTLSNPFLPGLWPLAGIIACTLLLFLVAAGLVVAGIWPVGALLLAGLPCVLFTTISLLQLWWGWRRARQSADFLNSARPVLRWTYTPPEWEALREADWQEARADWKLPIGCLAFLLGLAGLMVGGALAYRDLSYRPNDWEKLLEIAAGAIVVALIGALVGGVIGAIIAFGNRLTARHYYRQTTPGEVALGLQEIYFAGQYVRLEDDWNWLEHFEWQPGPPALLSITVHTWLPRHNEEIWEIMVPERVQSQVTAMVQQIKRNPEN